jgi:hypothetical protein
MLLEVVSLSLQLLSRHRDLDLPVVSHVIVRLTCERVGGDGFALCRRVEVLDLVGLYVFVCTVCPVLELPFCDLISCLKVFCFSE